MNVALIDYGVGNRRSVTRALERLGVRVRDAATPEALTGADAIVLPGVGAAGPALERLHASGLDRALARERRPILGICLGFQLMAGYLDESGVAGLGRLPGRIRALDAAGPDPVPHMGWSPLRVEGRHPLWAEPAQGEPVYFAHGYGLRLLPGRREPGLLASVRHNGTAYAAALARGNWLGLQFHPERSGPAGARLLAGFLDGARAAARGGPRAAPARSGTDDPYPDSARLIPALDVLDGRAVRLWRGRYDRVTDHGDPEVLIDAWYRAGARELHLVDLQGARDGRFGLTRLVVRAAAMGWRVQVGGGLRGPEAMAEALDAGASRVVLGTAAWRDPSLLERAVARFGAGAVVPALDLLGWTPQLEGWRTPAGGPSAEGPDPALAERLDAWAALGLQRVLCTAIERDGTMAGPDLERYARLRARWPDWEWVASGGIRDRADLRALGRIGIAAAVAGRAVLEGNLPPGPAGTAQNGTPCPSNA